MWRKIVIPLIPTWKQKKPDTTLEQMLQFAVEHVQYYRKFKGYRTLADFPLLTKEIIHREEKNLVSDDIESRRWFYNTSGGSTGEPVRVIQDYEMSKRFRWVSAETHRWAGYEPGDRFLILWGSSSENAYFKRWKAKLGLWIRNEIFLDTFELSPERIAAYVQIIKKFKPKLIVAYVSSISAISKYIIDNSIEIRNVGAIVTSAGTLYPHIRKTVEKAFNCRIYNRYGSRELTIMAAEDGSGQGLKVTPMVHIETIRPDGSTCDEGETGEIVVTSLANFSMPLIRYRIGDMGVLRSHANQAYLEKVTGRTVELFKTKDGKMIDGEYFTHLLYFKQWVQTFRFRQLDYEKIIVEIVLREGEKPLESDLSGVESKIKKVMGGNTKVEWDFLSNIPPLPSGKYVYTVCQIK